MNRHKRSNKETFPLTLDKIRKTLKGDDCCEVRRLRLDGGSRRDDACAAAVWLARCVRRDLARTRSNSPIRKTCPSMS
jgi:hypothetical protein